MELNDQQREFVRLLAVTERRLLGYVLTLVPNLADADEVLQETTIRLWEEQDKYRPGSDFAAWALRIAYYETLTWRKKRKRSRLVFDDELIERLSVHANESATSADARISALRECLEELSDRSRLLLQGIYRDGQKIKDIAATLSRTPDSVYKTVQRLRVALRTCIEHRLAEEA